MPTESLQACRAGLDHTVGGRIPGAQWRIAEDHEAMSQDAAARIVAELQQQPAAVLCLATGESPTRTYELLAARGQADPALCARARWVQLDEWDGLSPDNPVTCEAYLRRILIEPLQIPPERFVGWHRSAVGDDACRQMTEWLAAHGPIDLLVLGLGRNGHLGLNEPAEELQDGPHRTQLSTNSLAHSMLNGNQDNVRFGLTLGMGDILRSRRILLLVSGSRKAEQLKRTFSQPVAAQFPASFLQRHANVTIFCDRAAAGESGK